MQRSRTTNFTDQDIIEINIRVQAILARFATHAYVFQEALIKADVVPGHKTKANGVRATAFRKDAKRGSKAYLTVTWKSSDLVKRTMRAKTLVDGFLGELKKRIKDEENASKEE